MTATSSQLSVCQRALAQIGGKTTISSVFPSDGSVQANKCNLLYLPTFEALARTAWWDCLSQQATLSLLGAAAGTPEGGTSGTGLTVPTPWLYMYASPTNSLKARAIIPTFPFSGIGTPYTTSNNGAGVYLRGCGQIPFKVAYSTDASGNPLQVILTNQSQAQLAYIVNQPIPTIWDSQFDAAFVAALAAFLVPALAMNLPLMQTQAAMAERIIAEARASDANEGVSSQNREADWIVARSGGSGGWYGNLDGWQGPGYDNMNWGG